MNQLIALRMLEKLGYQVDAVKNGLEVLDALSRKSYDIILMDCQMPGMDGFEATKEIRILEGEARHTIIIAMTANALKGDAEACIMAGMDDYMSKPVYFQKMSAVIEGWLSKRVPPSSLSDPFGDPTAVHDEKSVMGDFDRAGFMDRILGDEALARELIEMFIIETPDHIEALRQAVQSGDAEQVRRHAHRIRGSALNMCGRNLGETAAGIERAGKAGDLSALEGQIAGLQLNFDGMKKLMLAEL